MAHRLEADLGRPAQTTSFLRTQAIFEWDGRDIDAGVASNFGRVTGRPSVVTLQVAIDSRGMINFVT